MSWNDLRNSSHALTATAAEVAWTQWSTILGNIPSRNTARSIIDPEALLIASASLSYAEPRLHSAARIWMMRWSQLISVQRTKNLLKSWPERTLQGVKELGSIALLEAGDQRWRTLASELKAGAAERDKLANPRFTQPAAVMFRLRLGFGMGIKADVLAYLIGVGGVSATIKEVSKRLDYYPRAVRRSLEELAAAGFIEQRPTAPVSYACDREDWKHLLQLDPNEPPQWRDWSAIYRFVANLGHWLDREAPDAESVIASEARDLLEQHTNVWYALGISSTELARFPGEQLVSRFREALGRLEEWVGGVV